MTEILLFAYCILKNGMQIQIHEMNTNPIPMNLIRTLNEKKNNLNVKTLNQISY